MSESLARTSEASRRRSRDIQRVLSIVIVFNIAVALVRITYGMAISSTAMQADGIDSLFDGMGSAIGMVAMLFASRPPDRNHPYGHRKFETYASLAIGAILLVGACRIAYEAVTHLMQGTSPIVVTPLSYAVMGATIVVNLVVSRYEGRRGRELASEILGADSKHLLMDVVVSVAVVAGLVLAQLGFPIADPIITLGVSVAILFTAWSVLRQGNRTLADSSRIPEADIRAVVDECGRVASCHKIRTRGLPSEVYMDLHVLVPPDMTVLEAHAAADEVERRIRDRFPEVADITIHIEPDIPEERHEL